MNVFESVRIRCDNTRGMCITSKFISNFTWYVWTHFVCSLTFLSTMSAGKKDAGQKNSNSKRKLKVVPLASSRNQMTLIFGISLEKNSLQLQNSKKWFCWSLAVNAANIDEGVHGQHAAACQLSVQHQLLPYTANRTWNSIVAACFGNDRISFLQSP